MNLLLKTKSNTTGSNYQRFFCCVAADGVSMGHIKSYLVLGVYTFTPSFQIQQTVCQKLACWETKRCDNSRKKNKKTSKIRCIPMLLNLKLSQGLKERNLRFPGFARVYLTRNSDRIVIQTPSSAKHLGDLALGIMVRMKSWRSIWDESQSHISKTIQSAKHPSDKMSLKFAVFTCPVFFERIPQQHKWDLWTLHSFWSCYPNRGPRNVANLRCANSDWSQFQRSLMGVQAQVTWAKCSMRRFFTVTETVIPNDISNMMHY